MNPDEVELVGIGDVLVVELFSADRPQIGVFRTVAEGSRLFRADQPVGVLLERLVELLPCLNRTSYVAVVDEVDGGNVLVSVQPDLAS